MYNHYCSEKQLDVWEEGLIWEEFLQLRNKFIKLNELSF